MKTKTLRGSGLLWVMALVLVLGFETGCASFSDKAGKSLQSVALTVDAGMKGWVAYARINQASQEDKDRVKALYVKYQLAMAAAETAYLTAVKTGDQGGWAAASAGLAAAAADLTALMVSLETNK